MSTFTEHEVQPKLHPYDLPCATCGHKQGDHVTGDGACGHVDCDCDGIGTVNDTLRTALISSVETDADVVQALRLWGAQLMMCATSKGAAEQSRLMLELADRVQARIESARKVLEVAR
jgi:hypothetical protein